jgi:hypothetical protein
MKFDNKLSDYLAQIGMTWMNEKNGRHILIWSIDKALGSAWA